jgi:pimeloyl-ACP methyl ester carboxylesterase
VTRPDSTLDHVTPYDRLAFSDVQVEHLLATGEHSRELITYFGEDEYRKLAALARTAQQTPPPADAPRVVIVPGIMGSNLGSKRTPPLPNDILWLDPVDIEMGHLERLRLPATTPIVSLGIVLYTYLRLKLHLRIGGFVPVFHDYDWRLGVDELGRGLAERLAREPGRVMIVAHSMGGLVSRAALASGGGGNVERVVLLGTPNLGSFAPVQALRGTYAVVRKIARLVETQSPEMLAAEVFSTFPSLYHLLPPCEASPRLDLFDAASWPSNGPQPKVDLLTRARSLALAPADERFAVIVGAGQETVTSVARHGDEFAYTITRQGDGTVPTACALLPGASTYYTSVAHSELARDEAVAQAIAEILHTGRTQRLTSKLARPSVAEARITDTELRRTHTGKVDWAGLEPDERRIFLQTLNEPPQLKLQLSASTSVRSAARRAKPTKRRAQASRRPAKRGGAASAAKSGNSRARSASKRGAVKGSRRPAAKPAAKRAAKSVARPARRAARASTVRRRHK